MGEQITQVDYQQLFDWMPAQSIVFAADDPTFTIVAENQGHARVAMSDPKSAVGKPLFDVFPDTSEKYKKTGVSDLLESFRKVIHSGKSDVMDILKYDIKRPDNTFEERFWRVTHYPIFDSAHQVKYIYQLTEDITTELATGIALDQTRKQLDETLSVGLIGTWIWDLGINKIIADRNLAGIFGVSPDIAAAGLPLSVFTDSIHEDDRKRIVDEISKTVAQKGTFVQEYRTVLNGAIRWVIARGKVETDSNGKALRFPGVIVDITERKQAEQSLDFLAKASIILSSSLNYTKTLQSIAKLVVPEIADWCTIDIYYPKKGLKQVALAHKDPKMIKWAKQYRKAQGEPDMDSPTGLPKVLRTGLAEFYPVITEEMLRASLEDKEQLDLTLRLGLSSLIIVPLKVYDKTVGAITLISAEQKRYYTQADLDMAEGLASRASLAMTNAHLYESAQDEIAERKKLEEKLQNVNQNLEKRVAERTSLLQSANANLERSNQELQDFAYVASHDLQEPLRKIQAFGNLLESEHGNDLGEGKDYLDRMRSAASRMSILIEDLLSFSRVTTKARPFVAVDLNKIIAEVLSDLEVRVSETAARVNVDDLPVISGDAVQMRQLLQNLLGNALKFSRPGVKPKIHVSSAPNYEKGDKIASYTITVRDNGIGFDDKYVDRIFAVFQRLHNKEAYQGTGIGLAICRKIVERHGGTITARSKADQGASFIIVLPAYKTKEIIQQ